MIKAVIIEDEPQSQEALAKLIELYCPGVTLGGITSSVEQARIILASTKPQLVFLDVELGNGTGFDLFKHFPEPPFEIVFTTAHEKFALEAIRFSCLDYLLKPIDYRELQRAVSRIGLTATRAQKQIDTLAHNLKAKNVRQYKMAISHAHGYDFISIDEIIMAMAEGNYTRIFTKEKEILTTRTLGEFENLLPSPQFFRTHKSYLINLSHLEHFNKAEDVIYLHGGRKAELASRRRDEFLRIVKGNSLKVAGES
jgi:two-component system LytT family response regulator